MILHRVRSQDVVLYIQHAYTFKKVFLNYGVFQLFYIWDKDLCLVYPVTNCLLTGTDHKSLTISPVSNYMIYML